MTRNLWWQLLLVCAAGLSLAACKEDSADDGDSGSGATGGTAGTGGGAAAGTGGSTAGTGGMGGSAAGTGGSTAGTGGTGGSAGGMGGTGGAGGDIDAGPLPPGVGWFELEETSLLPHCPSPSPGGGGCRGVINAWGSAIADTDQNRLILCGGGHGDYAGNELYAIDLDTRAASRITEPSPTNDCDDSLADGTPTSRHTYDGLVYLPDEHRMLVIGGYPYCSNGSSRNLLNMYSFDFGTSLWSKLSPSGPQIEYFVTTSDYDPVTGTVFIHDSKKFRSYDPGDDEYTTRLDSPTDYHLVGRVDVERRRFVMLGGGEAWSYELSGGYARRALSLPDCEAVVGAAYPGMAYDPVEKRIFAWVGGGTVYAIDPIADTCEARDFPSGPPPISNDDLQQPNGTHGRFRYLPSIDAFVVVNDMDQNAWFLRMR